MIKPYPESDLSSNIIVLGSEILNFLKEKRKYVFIDSIMTVFLSQDKKRTPEFFLDSLIFLYSLGLVDYKGHRIGIKYDLS